MREPNCPDRDGHAAALEADLCTWVEDTVLTEIQMLAAHDRERGRQTLAHAIGLLQAAYDDRWPSDLGAPIDIEDPNIDPCTVDDPYYLGPQPTRYELETAARCLLATRVTGWTAAINGTQSLGGLAREARHHGYVLVGMAELNALARFTPPDR